MFSWLVGHTPRFLASCRRNENPEASSDPESGFFMPLNKSVTSYHATVELVDGYDNPAARD
jgi:hypothetical protein